MRKKSKNIFKSLICLFLIFSWLLSGWPPIQIAQAVTSETFTASTSWLVPTGVTSVTAEVWGGGGGGGGQNLASDGGGGGGGGAYSKQTAITVIPGNSYTVTVGALGAGGNKGCGGTGGDSSFVNTATVLAKGGVGGCNSTGTPPAGGLGGASASGVGGTKFSGGQGEIGKNNATGVGGYGGSSAGTAADGFSGPQTWSTATYPTASTPTGGGHGGNGGAANAAGSAPASGNGGGGGGSGETTTLLGGAGAVGKVILTYNKPPNAPSQDSPANSATGVSVTPTFLMTATDADTTVDNLSYKVTIYSENTCTTVVQTNDQAVSATGWTGSNATCTASPTACYLSGTQGSFLTQTALTASTQYWWKASAKDPDGNGTFTNSSTCNNFITAAAAVVSVSVSDSTVTYGTMVAGASKTTIDLTDTQTLTNDGNVLETFNIKGQNTACPWTLAATAGTDQYVHEFCKKTDVSCASPPTNYTALTTVYQTLYTSVAATGTKQLDLRITVPTTSSCSTQQSADVTIQAVQQ